MNAEYCYKECERISKIMGEYPSCLKQCYDELKKKVVRYEYGAGDITVSRGYYCPSKIYDVIVGGAKRGRRLKKCRNEQQIRFIYGFDAEDRLLIIDDRECHTHEFIIYRENLQIGLYFRDWKQSLECCFDNAFLELESISECQYDETGKLESYMFCWWDSKKHKVKEFRKEEYEYYEDKFIAHVKEFFDRRKDPTVSHHKYYFSVVDGYLSTYTVETYSEQGRVPDFWDDHIFKVYEKRKVI